jgi:hypothetical protein
LLLLQSTQETSIDKSFKLFLQQKYGRWAKWPGLT